MKEYLFEWKELVEKSVNIVATSRVEAHRKWLEGDYNYEEVDINNDFVKEVFLLGRRVIQTRGFQYEYYTGRSYVAQEELYICSSKDIEEAKIYTSEKRATNAMETIEFNFCNSRGMRVVPVEE